MRTGEIRNLHDDSALVSEPELEVHIRQLDGAELTQIIGYDGTYLRPGTNWPDHATCTSFAGNAFSGFAIVPCLIALMAVVEPDCAWSRKTTLELLGATSAGSDAE